MTTHEQTFWIVRSCDVPARYFVDEDAEFATTADQARHFPTKEEADSIAEPRGMYTFTCRQISFSSP